MEREILIKTSDLNWCVDILKRLKEITDKFPDKPNNGYAVMDYSDIQQIKYLIKQGLHVDKKDD